MNAPTSDLSDLWIKHQRKTTKTTLSWACIFCTNRKIFTTEQELWEHGKADHGEQLLEAGKGDLEAFREQYVEESAQKR